MQGWFVSILTCVALAGCNDKHGQENAQAAQNAAASTAAAAQKEADDKIAAAHADEQAAIDKAARERTEAKVSVQKDVDAVDRKLTYLKDRMAKLPGAKKVDAQRAADDTAAKREAVRVDLGKLDTTTGAAWDGARADVSRDMVSLQTSTDRFETMVTGKPAH